MEAIIYKCLLCSEDIKWRNASAASSDPQIVMFSLGQGMSEYMHRLHLECFQSMAGDEFTERLFEKPGPYLRREKKESSWTRFHGWSSAAGDGPGFYITVFSMCFFLTAILVIAVRLVRGC